MITLHVLAIVASAIAVVIAGYNHDFLIGFVGGAVLVCALASLYFLLRETS